MSCSPKGFLTISKQIELRCESKDNTWSGVSFHSLRTKLHNEGKLNFINIDLDTLYLLESYEIENGTYIGRIWNAKSSINYAYTKNNFSYNSTKLYTEYTVNLIQKWDTLRIRKEETENANSLHEKYINGARIFISKGNAQIECITFKEFFNLERDR